MDFELFLPWATVNTRVQVFIWVPIFIPLGVYLGVELLGHIIILGLTFWGTD